MDFTEFMDHFGPLEENGSEAGVYLTNCPAHTDSDPSLVVWIHADRVGLECRAGCEYADIMHGAGLKPGDNKGLTGAPALDTAPAVPTGPVGTADRGMLHAQAYGWASLLTVDDAAKALLRDRFGLDIEGLAVDALHALGLGADDGRLMVVAHAVDGQPAFAQGRATDSGNPLRWKGHPNPADGRWDAAGFVGKVDGARPVIVCEGPSDALTVAALDVVDAVAIRGAGQARRISEVADALKGRTVYVAGDGDDAGRKFSADVADALKGVAGSVGVLPVPDGMDLGDVRQKDPAGFRAALEDLMGQAETPDAEPSYRPTSLAEADLAARLGTEYLKGRFLAWGRHGWSRWDGKRWETCDSETPVYGAMRAAVQSLFMTEVETANRRLTEANKAADGMDEDAQKPARKAAADEHARRMKALNGLFYVNKIQTLMRGAREVLYVDAADFDTAADLFNAANGVIDMRTGELRPHDPTLLFTKVTATEYKPGCTHPDWDAALTALPDDVAEWMQTRFGQAATGYSTPDDIVPFLYGGGENGKSTVLDGVFKSFGEFKVQVPDKVLLGNSGDHSTEYMTLKGARLAYIEELPEGDYLNAQRLKKIAGTAEITARAIGENNVTWEATHSLFVTTNYDVKVDAVDHGTWRRLALVRFPYKYDGSDPAHPKDPTLRERIKHGRDGQHEAAMAWWVEGSMRLYADGMVLPSRPESVQRDTESWKGTANQAIRFLDENYELDPNGAVIGSELFTEFKEWADGLGMRRWGDQTFWSRAKQHDWFMTGKVEKPSDRSRTSTWRVHSANPGYVGPLERLVTGIRPISKGDPGDRPTGEAIFA